MTSFPPYSAADISVLRRADRSGQRSVEKPNPVSIKGGWNRIPVIAPSTLVFLAPPQGSVYYRPFDMGDSTSQATLQATCFVAGPSIPLSAPGVWWVYNAGTSVNGLMIDATASIDKAWFDGYLKAAFTRVDMNTAAAQTVLAANAYRRMVAIQNNGTTPVRLRWDGTDPTTATGFRLLGGQTLVMDCCELTRNQIRGIEESGTPQLEVIEGS